MIDIGSVSQDMPLKAVISIYPAAQESERLTAPCIPDQAEPLTGLTGRYTYCLGFDSEASLVSTFMVRNYPSLFKLALQAINEREQGVRCSEAESD